MLASIENKAGGGTVSKYVYTMDTRGQRTQVSQGGSAFAAPSGYGWLYNSKGEVVAANHTADTAKNRAYHYDPIGNRRWATEGNPAASAVPETPDPLAAAIARYTANNLNQYTSVTTAPTAVKTPLYDADGNMTNTGEGVRYTWDAENRLIRVTKPDGTEIRNTYDGESRRVKREVHKNGALQSTVWYFYDGWNVVAEFATGGTGNLPAIPTATYTWGQDLSGSLQGAGGVGGLLSKKDTATNQAYHYTYDGNGNVSELIAADNNTIAAHYEYDAFGKTVHSTGSQASSNTYRFSTKPLDAEADLYYYGYRFYDPQLGRWPNRDPIGVRGGANLHGMLQNNVICLFDFLGLSINRYAYPNGISEVFNQQVSEAHTGAQTIHEGKPWRISIISEDKTYKLSISGEAITFSIRYSDADGSTRGPSNSGLYLTYRDHERQHVKISGNVWNEMADTSKKFEQISFCNKNCAALARDVFKEYYNYKSIQGRLLNYKFDWDEYGHNSQHPGVRLDLLTKVVNTTLERNKSSEKLASAHSLYHARGCYPLIEYPY